MSAAAGLLQGAHAVIAMRRGPHWLLNDSDAKAYGLALANALRHLPVTMAQKYVDFAALGIAIFAYEGPRIGIDMQIKRDRQQQRRTGPAGTSSWGPAQVFQFRPNPAAPAEPVQPAPAEGPMTYEPDFAS